MDSSSFTKARAKFSHTAFIELNHQANPLFYQHNTVQQWYGFRVLVVDGSKYRLPDTPAIRDEFSGQSNQYEETPMALGSCLYDVFQGLVVDALLAPYKTSERELAYCHLPLAQSGDLILYDRGYPAFWLFAAHYHQEVDFCMRVKTDFNRETKDFVASGKQQAIVTLTPTPEMRKSCQEKGLSAQAITVRLLQVKTSKGNYILVTSLLNKRKYPLNAFKALYHQRWQVEEGYKKQKCWLEIENFSGKTVHAVKQDFYARTLNLTLAAITAFAASPLIGKNTGQRHHAYKINLAQTISSMKDTLVRIFLGYIDSLSLMQWLKSIAQSLSIIRPERSFERKKTKRLTSKYHFPYKRSL